MPHLPQRWEKEPAPNFGDRPSFNRIYATVQCGFFGFAVLPGTWDVRGIYSAVVGVHGRVPAWFRHCDDKERDIASSFRLLLLSQALSLPMCAELSGCFLGRPHDLVLVYMAMPFGRKGAPANCAIFGDAISRMHAMPGMGRPDWYMSIRFLSKLYVGNGLLFDIRNAIRQRANALTWGHIMLGLLWPNALNQAKLAEKGQRSTTNTMLGLDINSASPSIAMPDPKIAGARALVGHRIEHQGSRALEMVTLQQARGHIEHFRSPNSKWNLPTPQLDS